MKLIVAVAFALVAVAMAAPPAEQVPIVRSEDNKEPDGSYSFSFESADGTIREEIGELKEVLDEEGKPRTVVVVRGKYIVPREGGVREEVVYSADEKGYVAEGPTIPKAVRR